MNNNAISYKIFIALFKFFYSAFEILVDVIFYISLKIRDMFNFFDSYSSKYYFSMNVFNDLKKIKLSTKTKFKPAINNFFDLVDELSKDKKYCSWDTFSIVQAEFKEFLKTDLLWLQKVLKESYNYYDDYAWAGDWYAEHLWQPKHENVSDEYNEEDYWTRQDDIPEKEYKRCKNEYWIWRLKEHKDESSIRIIQTFTDDNVENLTEEDYVFMDELLSFFKFNFRD